MSGFLKKLGEEIEETLADVEPMAGDPQGLDVARISQAEGFVSGDHSPAAEEEAREGQ